MRELPFIVVMGKWPKSGTSLLMQILDAGGAPAIKDPEAPDWTSPMALGWPDLVLQNVDRRSAVKLWQSQIHRLLDAGIKPAAVVTPIRPYQESVDSWAADGHAPFVSFKSQAEVTAKWRKAIRRLRTENVNCIEVEFHELIDSPKDECHYLADALGGAWDREAMSAVPDLSRRHWPSSA